MQANPRFKVTSRSQEEQPPASLPCVTHSTSQVRHPFGHRLATPPTALFCFAQVWQK
jgi:hypothetical protein